MHLQIHIHMSIYQYTCVYIYIHLCITYISNDHKYIEYGMRYQYNNVFDHASMHLCSHRSMAKSRQWPPAQYCTWAVGRLASSKSMSQFLGVHDVPCEN